MLCGAFSATFVDGEMSEWSKEHAWRACRALKALAGSNPALSATRAPAGARAKVVDDAVDAGRHRPAGGDGLVLRGGNL